MLKARSIIILSLAIALLSLVVAMLSLMRPPDSKGRGHDTYGTWGWGQRALFETLARLGVPIERSFIPPDRHTRADTPGGQGSEICLAFLAPDPGRVAAEPVYLRRIGQWVRAGGRVIVAPANTRSPEGRTILGAADGEDDAADAVSVLDALGLPGVVMTWIDADDPEKFNSESQATDEDDLSHAIFLRNSLLRPLRAAAVESTGVLAELNSSIETLDVADRNLMVIDGAARPAPAGRLHLRNPAHARHSLAAVYPLGKGEVVVIAEPALLINKSLAQGDNSVLAAALFARAGRPVVVDEFYHGLNIRGRSLWLLTRHPYGLMAGLLALAALLWVGRNYAALGPPLPERTVNRRTVLEYVEAMAGVFDRKQCGRFLLEELRGGVLWSLRRRLHLSPRDETPETLAAHLERRGDPAGPALRQSAGAVEALLAQHGNINDRKLTETARRIMQCR